MTMSSRKTLKTRHRSRLVPPVWKNIAFAGSVFAGLLLSFCAAMLFLWKPNSQATSRQQLANTAILAPAQVKTDHVTEPDRGTTFYKLGQGQHLASFLQTHGWSKEEINSSLAVASTQVNLKKLRTGMSIGLSPSETNPRQVTLQLSHTKDLKLRTDKTTLETTAKTVEYPVTKKKLHYRGLVQLSLWESAKRAGMPPALIDQLTDVFAWQIDFAKQVRSGDRWKISVERKYVRGKPVGHGPILAAQFESDHKKLTAIRFPQSGDNARYYFPDGRSLEGLFLKSPVRYNRISSRFQRNRYHPVLKRRRPHLGVDYAAAPGTPVKSVGDGRVVYAKWSGGGGRVVKIKHNSTYSTAYMHLSKYAKDIKAGSRVRQGQVIGYVGSSGLASGPHLHFSFYEHGKYINPLGKKFPSANPIVKNKMKSFQQTKIAAMSHLSVNTF